MVGLQNDQLLKDLSNAKLVYPLSLVYHGYARRHIAHPLNGFGFLVPEVENRKILGTLFSSTIFPGRAPKNHVLLTTFVGGERQPDLAEWEDDKIHNIVQDEHADLLGTSKLLSSKKLFAGPKPFLYQTKVCKTENRLLNNWKNKTLVCSPVLIYAASSTKLPAGRYDLIFLWHFFWKDCLQCSSIDK